MSAFLITMDIEYFEIQIVLFWQTFFNREKGAHVNDLKKKCFIIHAPNSLF
jgi:hypothetical protein